MDFLLDGVFHCEGEERACAVYEGFMVLVGYVELLVEVYVVECFDLLECLFDFFVFFSCFFKAES